MNNKESNVITTNSERTNITKREVSNLMRKISCKIPYLKNIFEIENLIKEIAPDASEIISETFINNSKEEFFIGYLIPRIYTGKHSKTEYSIMDKEFDQLISHESITLYIYKNRETYDIHINSSCKYLDIWGIQYENDFSLKIETIPISLDIRKHEIESLLCDIRSLSSGTIANLLEKEEIGEARTMYSFIDEVQRNFIQNTEEYINTTNKIPKDWNDAWNIFKSNTSLKQIAYNLGIDKSKIEINSNIETIVTSQLKDLKKYFDDFSECEKIDIADLSRNSLKKLTISYALDKILWHCKKNNKESINKLMTVVIPKIENDQYDDEFYNKYALEGLKVLKGY